MQRKRTDYSNEIMHLLARTLSVNAVTCVHCTDNGLVKSWLDNDLLVHNDGKVSTSDLEKRKLTKNKRTSWETTGNIDSKLFDDQNLTLCLRLTSPIDNLDDLYYVTVRPSLGSLNILVSNGYETTMSVQDKEIIAALCYSSAIALVEILRLSESKQQILLDDIRHKDKTIMNLKREMEIPADKTKKLIKEKLAELGKLYEKEFTLTKDAESIVNDYAGGNISPLLSAIERAANIKVQVYDYTQITIDDTDLQIKFEVENEISENVRQESSIEKRHSKVIAYLEKLEEAYNTTVESGNKPTAINIANAMNVSSASITMWFNKHSEDAKRMCDANVNLCANSRRHFYPLKEALAGKRNKEKCA